MCMNVDLPEPDGPVTATNSPALISSDTPRKRADLVVAHPVDLGEIS